MLRQKHHILNSSSNSDHITVNKLAKNTSKAKTYSTPSSPQHAYCITASLHRQQSQKAHLEVSLQRLRPFTAHLFNRFARRAHKGEPGT